MSERYACAAFRHLRVAETLFERYELDDAGYHFGICGECALKAALVKSGLPTSKRARQHLPQLLDYLKEIQSATLAFAAGRANERLLTLVSDRAFAQLFHGWKIDIRYADDQCTPVEPAVCESWRCDARRPVRELLLS